MISDPSIMMRRQCHLAPRGRRIMLLQYAAFNIFN
jgi:hypothetical protein